MKRGLTLVAVVFWLMAQLAWAQSPRVGILVETANGSGFGQGCLIEVDESQPAGAGFVGKVLTAAHVVVDATQIKVIYSNGRRSKDCRVIAQSDEYGDVAIITVWVPPGIEPADVADEDVKPGDPVAFHCLTGSVPAVASDPTNTFIYSDLTLRAGDSGGPVFNQAGKVVGVISGGWFWYGDVKISRKTTWPAKAANTAEIRKLLDGLK